MNLRAIIMTLFSCVFFTKVQAQFTPQITSDQESNMAYIIDSVGMFGNYDRSFRYDQRTIVKKDTVQFIRRNEQSKKLLQRIDSLYGFRNLEEVIFMYTAPYLRRSEALKKMPQTTFMQIRNDCFYLPNADTTYSGDFINYNIDGTVTAGSIVNGKTDGVVSTFNNLGKIINKTTYENGIINGMVTDYNDAGQIKRRGFYKYALKDSIWLTYFPTGQIRKKEIYKNNLLISAPQEYYSTGKQKFAEINNTRWSELMKDFNKAKSFLWTKQFPLSIHWYEKCIEIDSAYADAYYQRAIAHSRMLTLFRGDKKMNREIDTTISLLNKAIAIEPLYMEAYRDRAYTRLAKFRFNIESNGGKLDEKSRQLICDDLHHAQRLGDVSMQTQIYINQYCR